MFGSDIIRVRIKGFLKNITEKENIFFDEKGIRNKNRISFIFDGVKYNIKYSHSNVILSREGKEFVNTFLFNEKSGVSIYTLKDNNYTIEMNIIVKEIFADNNLIYVNYLITETNCQYEYKIELSESL